MPEHNAECLYHIKNILSRGEKNTSEIIKHSLEVQEQYAQEIFEILEPYHEEIEKLADILKEKEIIRQAKWNHLLEEIL